MEFGDNFKGLSVDKANMTAVQNNTKRAQCMSLKQGANEY